MEMVRSGAAPLRRPTDQHVDELRQSLVGENVDYAHWGGWAGDGPERGRVR